jgi:hypothetical protein
MFLVLLAASLQFDYGEGHTSRPIIEVVHLLRFASLVHAVAAIALWRSRPSLGFVLFMSVVFRLTLLNSKPIQESDFYRYIWDGKVVVSGLDPYRYSPDEIEDYARWQSGLGQRRPEWTRADLPALGRLADLRNASPSNRVIFRRINHHHLATIYPLSAQGAFAIAAHLTVDTWSVYWQIVVLKCVVTLFDLGTLIALVFLLRAMKLPAALALIYGWSPLVIKEFAGTGHVDAVAGFFLVLSLLVAVKGRPLLTGAAMAAAVLAKLYAIAVAPFVLILLLRSARATTGVRWHWSKGGLGVILVAAILGATCWIHPESREVRAAVLRTFLDNWENHDALFLWIRTAIDPGGTGSDGEEFNAMARRVVGIFFLMILIYHVAREVFDVPQDTTIEVTNRRTLGRVFAVLAAIFLLSPIGFPWYFTWCVPLLPFARCRCWYFLPGFLSTYYLFFWFNYWGDHLEERGVTARIDFHHDVLVSCEFGLFFLIWFAEGWFRGRRRYASGA